MAENNAALGFADLGRNIVVNRIRDRLQDCDHPEIEEISRLLEVLIELDLVESTAGDTLRLLSDGGQILHYFSYAHTGAKAQTPSAWCILALLCFTPSIGPPPSVGNSARGYSSLLELFKEPDPIEVREFSKLMVRYKDRLTLEIMKRSCVANKFLAECLKHIAGEPSRESFFTSDLILQNWDFLRDKISGWQKEAKGSDGILARFANNPNLIDEVRRSGFEAGKIGLYRVLIENEKSDSSAFRDWCRDNLQKLTTEEWESDIEGHAELTHLASAIRKTGAMLNLGVGFQNAIVSTVKRSLNHEAHDPLAGLIDMGFLLDDLTDDERLSVCARVYDAVKLVNGDLPDGFFSSYGKFISDPKILKLDEHSLSSLFRPAVENGDESGLKWVTKVLINNPSLLENHPVPGPASDFKRMVLVALSESDAATTPLISELARAIKLENLKDDLPRPPWTVQTLGEPLYRLIAKEGGYFDPDREPANYRPALGALGTLESDDSTQGRNG